MGASAPSPLIFLYDLFSGNVFYLFWVVLG